jgi:hypothetical protein
MFQFDVALSFAGEDRVYAGDIAERFRSHDVRVFYDEYEQAMLWGKDLYEHLDYVYQRAGRFTRIESISYPFALMTQRFPDCGPRLPTSMRGPRPEMS